MANQVVLTFAGESKSAESAFDRVGGAARRMDGDARAAGEGFDRVGEAADNVDTKAMGFRDTLTGVQDGFAGLKRVTSGDIGFESLLLLGMGVGDLASGMFNFLIPSMKSAVLWLGNTKVGMLATAAAQKIWTAAQWLFNTALLASPITWIILGIVALVAVIVLIATKTDWFQRAWGAAWGWIKSAAVNVWDWLRGLPDRLAATFGRVAGAVSAPFRAAFNLISDAWNNTIGRLSWTVPGWVPVIGGATISAPKLPRFHSGGIVPGPPGSEMLGILQAGERITASGGSAGAVIEIRSGGSTMDDLLVEILANAIRVRGGNVQLVLGAGGG